MEWQVDLGSPVTGGWRTIPARLATTPMQAKFHTERKPSRVSRSRLRSWSHQFFLSLSLGTKAWAWDALHSQLEVAELCTSSTRRKRKHVLVTLTTIYDFRAPRRAVEIVRGDVGYLRSTPLAMAAKKTWCTCARYGQRAIQSSMQPASTAAHLVQE